MGRGLRNAVAFMLTLIALPASRITPQAGDKSLAERVSTLEEFRAQQRDWNNWMDSHVSARSDDASKSLGAQDVRFNQLNEKIADLEARLLVIYSFGGLGTLLLSVLGPIAWTAYTKRHGSLMRRMKRVENSCIRQGLEILDEDEG